MRIGNIVGIILICIRFISTAFYNFDINIRNLPETIILLKPVLNKNAKFSCAANRKAIKT